MSWPWRRQLVVVALLAAAAALPAESHADSDVAHWDAVATEAVGASGLTSAEGGVIFAYQAIAVYDSVVAIEGGYRPFEVDVDAPARASAEAAVAAAAHSILVHHLPEQRATILDPALAEALAGIPDGRAKTAGVATGKKVAARVIARRADDGFRAPVTYVPPDPPVPGAWIPTAPTPVIGAYLGRMRPFGLHSADQFRPAGPPALATRRWARDYNEVKRIGSSTSTTRTPEQTLAARFWAEPPVQQSRASFRNVVLERRLDVVHAARLLAMISVTYADALIACFDAKYHYAFWRPVTAIHAGGDPAWSPLIATPNHPEYPSAHSCVTPAAGRAIARFLGTRRIEFTVPSVTGLGDRHFTTVKDLQDEVGDARVWGGIHYRSAIDDGIAIARRTARHVLSRHFQPARQSPVARR